MSQKCLVASLVDFFQKTTGQILRGVICLCTHGGERSRQAPDELDILTSVPCVGAVTEATRKLTLNGGADGSSVKVG